MSRKTSLLFALLIVGAGIVMMVRAQDSSEGFSSGSKPKASLADRLKALRQNLGGTILPSNDSASTPTPVVELDDDDSQVRSRRPNNPAGSSNVTSPSVGTPPSPSTSTEASRPTTPPKRSVDSLRGSTPTTGSSRRAERLPKIDRSAITPKVEPKKEEPAKPEVKSSANNDLSPTTPRVADRTEFNQARNVNSTPTQNVDTTPSQNFNESPNLTQANDDVPTSIVPKVENLEISSIGPSIKVVTVGPRAITLGKAATFVVQATNQGSTSAREIIVAIDLPDWVDVTSNRASSGTVRKQSDPGETARLIWTIDRLAGSAESQLALNLMATENRPIDLSIDWAFRPDTSNARVVVQQPKLDVAVSGPFDVLYGDDASYTITVSNPGTGTAENVVLNYPAEFGGEQEKVGIIPAGQRRQFDAKLTTRQSGELAIRVQAFGDAGLKSEVTQRIVVRRAKLAVEIDGPKFKYAGSVAKYNFKVTNIGDATAEELVAAAALPVGAKYLGGLQNAEQVEGGMRWPIGTLNPGAERVYEVTCQLLEAGSNEFQAGVRAADGLQAANSVATTVEALADLKLSVNDPQGPQPVGERVSYQLKIINRGTKAATAVKVTVQFSDGIEPVGVDGGRAEVVPGQVLFSDIDRIEAGAEVVLTVTARGDKAGNHIYRSTLTCDNPETRRVSEGTTRFFGDAPPSTARTDNKDESQFETIDR